MKKQVFQTHKEAVKRALEELGVHKSDCPLCVQKPFNNTWIRRIKPPSQFGRVVLTTSKGQGGKRPQ